MKKAAVFITAICIITMLICACGKSEGGTVQTSAESSEPGIDTAICGNWKEDYFDSGFLFNADGTGTDTFWDLTFTYTCEGGEVLIVYDTDQYGASKYTYQVSGDSLTMTRIDEEGAEPFTYSKVAMPETAAEEAADDESETDTEGAN